MTTYWGCIRRRGVSEKKEDDETWGKAQSGRAEERLDYNQPFLLNNGVQRSSHQKIWEREGNCGKWRGHQRPRLHSAVAQGEEVLVIQKHLDIHSERLVYKRETILFTVTAGFAHCVLTNKKYFVASFSVEFNLYRNHTFSPSNSLYLSFFGPKFIFCPKLAGKKVSDLRGQVMMGLT